jgi:glycosyltransferase involved in cell wall biosynthesis
MTVKKTILVLTAYFAPGFKAGGPIRSIEGFADVFSNDYNIKIVTNDRDLNDEYPYKNIDPNSWQNYGNAKVFYLTKNFNKYYNLFQILSKNNYDIIYLNSFFCFQMSIFPIMLHALKLIPRKSLILAPRGEFSPEALKIKSVRKKIYIKIFECIKSANNIFWQASTQYEKMDILNNFPKLEKNNVFVAGNLSKSLSIKTLSQRSGVTKNEVDNLRLVFLSRISVKKNLDYALNILSSIDFNAEFDIYGPIEDKSYWQKCLKIIKIMPDNIKVKYCGSLSHERVISTLMQYDLFFFPTRGENYGHVIEEALHAGLPILISDQTPWQNLETIGIGCDIALEDRKSFTNYLKKYHQLSVEEKNRIKQDVSFYSNKIRNKENIVSSNRLMIETALSASNKRVAFR